MDDVHAAVTRQPDSPSPARSWLRDPPLPGMSSITPGQRYTVVISAAVAVSMMLAGMPSSVGGIAEPLTSGFASVAAAPAAAQPIVAPVAASPSAPELAVAPAPTFTTAVPVDSSTTTTTTTTTAPPTTTTTTPPPLIPGVPLPAL